MPQKTSCWLFAFLLVTASIAPAQADVTMPAFFSDHAVLQKADKVAIWGNGEPGEAVTVTLDKASASAKAGDDGKWRTSLDLHSEGPGPHDLVVQGKNRLTASDVLVGEVWLCGGQSNMEFPLGAFPIGKTEVPASTNPLLRRFKVKFNPSPVPVEDVQGSWELADPKTAGTWTATGYFFGKKIQAEVGGPVGLLEDCIGGTMIETWMSADALANDSDLKAGAEKSQAERKAYDEYAAAMVAWQKQYNREDQAPLDPQSFCAPGLDTSDWKPVTLPGTMASAGLADAGAIWLRTIINVPANPDIRPGRGIDLYLADIQGVDEVYWNGRRTGSSNLLTIAHRYSIRSNFVNAGPNILAVRIFNPSGHAGIELGKAGHDFSFEANHYQLKGDWLGKVETALPPLDAAAQAALPQKPALPFEPQNVAGYLYNGMINPVVSYGIRGVIWYQGEGNFNRGFQYKTEFPELIRDWRAKWGEGNFPFYFCQIANNHEHSAQPGNDPAAELREAQDAGLKEPNTGEAILIDIGDELNIHPADKLDVGDRLSRIALAQTYGKSVPFSGPIYDSMTIENDKIRIHFKSTEGGLVAKAMPATYQPTSSDPKTSPVLRNSPDSPLEGFAISDENHQWHWANATIDGNSVIVSSADVPKPIAVRYAWAFNPWCNLYNGAGLPAGPFRTDDFPEVSVKARYGDIKKNKSALKSRRRFVRSSFRNCSLFTQF